MALLPLLGALVLGQSPAQIQIQSQVFRGNRIEIRGESFRAHVQDGLTIFEGVDTKQLLEKNKLEKLFAPTIRAFEGLACEAKIEGVPGKEFSLKYTADKDTSGSVVLHGDFKLAGVDLKSDFRATFGQTYGLFAKDRIVLIKVDRVSG